MMSDGELEGLYAELLRAVREADRPRALALALQAEEEGLEEPLVLVLAAEALEGAGEHAKAIPLLRRAVELAPGEAETWRRLSLALNHVSDRAGAAAAADRSVALAPSLYSVRIAAGAVYFSLGEFEPARTHYEAARALQSDAIEPLEGLAAIAVRGGDHALARSLAETVLARAPKSISARLSLARSALAEGKIAEAERSASELLVD